MINDPPNSTPPSFGKNVNDYLNHYITLADAKAAGFLAATLTLGGATVKLGPGTSGLALITWWGALTALATALAFNCSVIFPRLSSGRNGLIFWEDIRTRKSWDEYAAEVEKLAATDIEREYAAQNFFVSSVLHNKHIGVRLGIVTFAVGAALSALSYLARL